MDLPYPLEFKKKTQKAHTRKKVPLKSKTKLKYPDKYQNSSRKDKNIKENFQKTHIKIKKMKNSGNKINKNDNYRTNPSH